MTAQIDDLFRYHDEQYSVAGISTGELFDPTVLDLYPRGTCTACWRGYQVIYAVLAKHSVVADLHVNLLEDGEGYRRRPGPTINGVSATPSRHEHDLFNNHYDDLNYHLEYTGGLLLGHGFIQDLYVHMGFHPAWKFTSVKELVFENGVLSKEFDRSAQMAEVRQRIAESRDPEASSRMPTDAELRQFIERAFDRTYRMEM